MSKNASTTMKMIIDAQMNVNNVKNGLSAIASGLKELNVPKGVTTELQKELNSLNNKIKEFDLLAKDADNSFKNSNKIQKSFEGIDLQVKKFLQTYEEVIGLDPSKIFPKEITDRIKAATAAYEKYNKARKVDNDTIKQLKQDKATAQRKKSNAESTLEVRRAALETAKVKRDSGKQDKKVDISKLERANQILTGKIDRVSSNEGYKNLQAQKELLIQIEQKRKDINKLTRASNKTEKDSEDLKSYQKEKTQLEQQLKDVQSKVTKSQRYRSSSDVDDAIQKRYPSISENTKQIADNTAEINKNKDAIKELETSVTKAQNAYDSQKTTVETLTSSLNETSSALEKAQASVEGSALKEFYQDLEKTNVAVNKNANAQENYNSALTQIKATGLEKVNQTFEETAEKAGKANEEIKKGRENLQGYGDAAKNFQTFKDEIDSLGQRATYFLSLENSVDLFKQAVRQAVDTIKELDAAMTETAVVTDFSVGDMWEKLPEYTKMANELGVATKGVYDASTLYYQQGLQTEQVMALTAETLKMARIAGLECADATDLMTAALRGFNMEINEASAQRINDVYSELAAITAADTNEIATAMTKTASIAKSANMEFETTAALLSQMINFATYMRVA